MVATLRSIPGITVSECKAVLHCAEDYRHLTVGQALQRAMADADVSPTPRELKMLHDLIREMREGGDDDLS